MRLTLNIPDDKADFFLQLLANLPFVVTEKVERTTTRRRKTGPAPGQDTTDYLLASPANREQLLASIAEADRGQYFQHDLLD